jgi:hypothetical protein
VGTFTLLPKRPGLLTSEISSDPSHPSAEVHCAFNLENWSLRSATWKAGHRGTPIDFECWLRPADTPHQTSFVSHPRDILRLLTALAFIFLSLVENGQLSNQSGCSLSVLRGDGVKFSDTCNLVEEAMPSQTIDDQMYPNAHGNEPTVSPRLRKDTRKAKSLVLGFDVQIAINSMQVVISVHVHGNLSDWREDCVHVDSLLKVPTTCNCHAGPKANEQFDKLSVMQSRSFG